MGYKGKTTGHEKYSKGSLVKIDLHGKTASIAREIVIRAIQSSCAGDTLHIITGKGTARGKSILCPEIKQLVTSMGYTWRPAKLADGGDGVLVVQV